MDTGIKVNIKKLTKAQLKDMLADLKLPTTGKKPALERRLKDHYKLHPEDDEYEDYVSVQEEQRSTVSSDNNVKDDICPGDSASNIGSATTSVRSQRALNAAKLKSLEVKRNAMMKEQELKRKQAEIAAELERIKLDTEFKALEVEEEVLAEHDASRSPNIRKKDNAASFNIGEFLQASAKELAALDTNKEREFDLQDVTATADKDASKSPQQAKGYTPPINLEEFLETAAKHRTAKENDTLEPKAADDNRKNVLSSHEKPAAAPMDQSPLLKPKHRYPLPLI